MYFPIWRIDYVFNQKRYQVVLDGSSGEAFAAEFPTRSSSAYLAVAGLGFVAFIGEGVLATQALLPAIGVMVATLIGIFAAALYVARRM